MVKKVYIHSDNIYSKIETRISSDIIDRIYNICSYNQEVYDPREYKSVDKKISVFNKHTNVFPSGLNNRVSNLLRKYGYRAVFSNKKEGASVDIDKIIKRFSQFELSLRDYQIEGAIAGIENDRGLFDWCTGSGKTLMFSFLTQVHNDTTLILVNRKELMEQISGEISRMTGNTVGMIGDGKWSPSKWTIAIVDTLRKGLNSDSPGLAYRTKTFLKKIKVFIGDEVHHLGASSWMDIAKACVNANKRYGFSGTCVRPDSEDIFLISFTGEIISQVKSNDLVKRGWLGHPYIYMPNVSPSTDHPVSGWHETKRQIINSDEIIESGVKFVKSMYNKGLSCIYFAGNDVPYGKRIMHALIDSGISHRDVRFMSGSENMFVRKKVLEDYRNHKLQILGGTSIYDEGIDVPHTDAGANFGQGFSMISTIQRLGRCLRKVKKEGSNDVDQSDKQIKRYWDPYNDGNRISQKHSDLRKSLYEENDSYKIFERDYGSK